MSGPRTLILDNNDSFTFNLVQCLGLLGAEPEVITAGASPEMPNLSGFDLVVISPGPGAPSAATDARLLLDSAAGRLPVLGVCLGHQVIAEAYGGTVEHAPEPRHGMVSRVDHDGKELFDGLPNPFDAVRYHSLAVSDPGPILQASAWSEDRVIQGLRHPSLDVDGLQFHPESVLTVDGSRLLANFLAAA